MNKKEIKRRQQILNIFAQLYPDPRTELDYRNPYELVVAVSLSAQCTDKKVNEITIGLFKKYPNFSSLAKGDVTDIEMLIKQVNYFKTKSKSIKAMAEKVVEEFSGVLPANHADLISLPGVGNKTANVVLSELGIAPAFPVDTHVFRVSKRLALATGKDVVQVEQSIKEYFEPALWHDLHHYFILHGRRVCKAQRPLCELCPLQTLCPSAIITPPAQ